MTFYAIQIDECPGFGWEGGAEFATLIRQMENGRNRRKPTRYVALHRYVAPYNNIPVTAARNIKRMHMAMIGMAHTFLHIDHVDNKAVDGMPDGTELMEFAVGDGVTTVFQLEKTYDPGGGATHVRIITKPDVNGDIPGPNGEPGSPLAIYVDGIEPAASVDPLTGEVDFGASPPADGAVLSWTGKHYVCVRFNRDDLPFSIDNKSGTVFITNGSLELIEELNE